MKKIRFTAGILVISLIAGLFGFNMKTPIYAAENEVLGDITHYNGFIFDYFESERADIEGALAVGGRSKLGTSGQYDLGASSAPDYSTVSMGEYNNPKGYPTLLLGDAPISVGRYVNAYGGPVVVNGRVEAEYKQLANKVAGTTKYISNPDVDGYFDEMYGRVVTSVNALNNAHKDPEKASLDVNKILGWNPDLSLWSDLSRFVPDNLYSGNPGNPVSNIIVVNLESNGFVNINQPNIVQALAQYDLIVFNFPDAVSVKFSGGSLYVPDESTDLIDTSAPGFWYPDRNARLKKYAEKVVWNFPKAETIQIEGCGVVGSVLAPYGYLEADGGSINGMLVADSFKTQGGMELHSFKMKKNVFDYDDTDEPEPDDELVGTAVFHKLDKDTGAGLEGVKFFLEVKENESWIPFYNPDIPLSTDDFGRLIIDELPVGEYRLKEIGPLSGYVTDSSEVYFKIIEQGGQGVFVPEASGNSNKIYNEKPKTNIMIAKVNQLSNGSYEELAGASFVLYDQLGDIVDDSIASDSNGIISIGGLTAGTYKLVETKAPEGFVIPEKYAVITIEITYNGVDFSIRYFDSEGAELDTDADGLPMLPNEPEFPKNKVLLTKVNAEDYGERLFGAKFQLYGEDFLAEDGWALVVLNGNDTFITDENGHIEFENLEPKRYKLVEVEPPDGFAVSEKEYEFEVQQNGGSGEVIYITAENDPLKGSVKIIKTDDAQPANLLSGAKFALYYKLEGGAMRLAGEGATDGSGELEFKDLKQGGYVLIETEAPAGCVLPENNRWEFAITTDSVKELHHEITIANKSETYDVTVIKVDSDDYSLALTGAVFDLYIFSRTDRGWNLCRSDLAVDGGGKLIIEGLPLGVYMLKETQPPAGYVLTDDSETIFTITGRRVAEVDNIVDLGTIYVENKKEETVQLSRELYIKKIDGDTKEPLVGAVFEVLEFQGESRSLFTPVLKAVVTDEEGKFNYQFTEGRYQLREVQKPPGYGDVNIENVFGINFDVTAQSGQLVVPVDSVEVFGDGDYEDVIYDGDGSLGVVLSNETHPQFPGITIIKEGDQGQPLFGAEFHLYRRAPGSWSEDREEDYNLYSVLRSNEDGIVYFPQVEEGDYYLVETEAPQGYFLRGSDKFYFKVVQDPANVNKLIAYYVYQGKEIEITDDLHYELIIKNYREGSLTVIKKDGTDDGTIPNVKFHLYYLDDNGVPLYYSEDDTDGMVWTEVKDDAELLTTDSNGQITISGLPYRQYYLDEVAAPGYDVSISDVPVFINDREVITEIYNYKTGVEKPTRDLTIIKRDGDTGSPLKGAAFYLYYVDQGVKHYYNGSSDTSVWQVDSEAAYLIETGEEGTYEVKGLPLGVYYLQEIYAVDGYELLKDPVEVTLGKDRLPTTQAVIDNYRQAELQVVKVSSDDGSLLSGACFTLSCYDENNAKWYYRDFDDKEGIARWTRYQRLAQVFTSDKDQNIAIKGLTVKGESQKYYLEEISAPEGYLMPENPVIVFTIEYDDAEGIVVKDAAGRQIGSGGPLVIEVENTPSDSPGGGGGGGGRRPKPNPDPDPDPEDPVKPDPEDPEYPSPEGPETPGTDSSDQKNPQGSGNPGDRNDDGFDEGSGWIDDSLDDTPKTGDGTVPAKKFPGLSMLWSVLVSIAAVIAICGIELYALVRKRKMHI